MLEKKIPINGSCIIHSNPQNANNESVVPPSDVTWGVNTTSFGTVTPQGTLNVDAKFQAGSVAGVTIVTMACQDKAAQVQVTVEAPAVLPFDHFSPSFD